MQVRFEQDNQLAEDELLVTLRAARLSSEVIGLLQQIEQWPQTSAVLPINVEDRIVMVPLIEIIAIEIYDSELTIHTEKTIYQQRGVLKKLLTRLEGHDFIQVAKGAVINLNHLSSLEAEFSGNMTAQLTNQLKISVSRKYLPALKQKLGM